MARWAALCLLLACAGTMTQLASSQQPLPILGQNVPPDGITQVVVDVIFDSLESINQLTNSWTGVLWFHFTWYDPRAEKAIMESTDTWINTTYDTRSNTAGGCVRPCDSSWHQSSGCCDNVWLPHIDLSNMMKIDQESVYKQRVWLEPVNNTVTSSGTFSKGIVHWMVRVTGTFHSPFDFRAWPFEHQHLLVEMQVQPSIADRVYLDFNGVAFLKNTPHTKGELVPGWWVAKTTKHLFNTTACYQRINVVSSAFDVNSTTRDAVIHALPVSSYAMFKFEDPTLASEEPNLQVTNIAADECQRYLSYTGLPMNPEAMTMYSPQIHVVDVMVKRAKGYYVLSTLVPLLVLTYMTFVIYAMERTDLEARMGVVVTLVLSVSALQFTYDFPPANYLNAIQQLTVTAYILYGLVACECMITAYLSKFHGRRRHMAQIESMAMRAASSSANLGGTSYVFRDGRTPFDNGPQKALSQEPSFDSQPTMHRMGLVVAKGARDGLEPAPRVASADAEVMVVETTAPSSSSAISATTTTAVQRATSTQPLMAGGRKSSQLPQAIAEGTETVGNGKSASPAGSRGLRFELSADAEAGKGMKKPPPAAAGGRSTVKQISKIISRRWSNATAQLDSHRRRLDRDEAYTLLFAAKLDKWFCWTLILLYTVTMIILLVINTQVGDHKMMLHGRPANM